MKKTTITILAILTLALTACSGASNSASSTSVSQSGSTTGDLPAATQIALGTLKLEGTDQAVTTEQATQLLPLWQTLEALYASDTAAQQEIEALTTQIQETMTPEQASAITAMNLTRQDMITVMREQGVASGNGSQNSGTQSGNTARNNNGGGFGPGGDFGQPADGGLPGGGFGGGGGSSLTPEQIATAQALRSEGGGFSNFTRIPTALVQAIIQLLQQKAGS